VLETYFLFFKGTYWLYIVKSSGKLLHFTNVFSIDETALFFINWDDRYSVSFLLRVPTKRAPSKNHHTPPPLSNIKKHKTINNQPKMKMTPPAVSTYLYW